MGLKVNRTRTELKARSNQSESSTVSSARYAYDALVNDPSRPTISVKILEFTNEIQHLDDAAVERLFDHLWKKLETDHRSDVILDFASFLTDVGPRFQTELAYLRRRIHHQGRSVRLINVSKSIANGRLFEFL